MRGLLYKDILTLWKAGLLPIYLVIVVVMSLSADQNFLMLLFPCLFAATLPMTLLAYDEKSRWDRYVQGLPVTRAQSVHAKYILALCIVGAFSLLATTVKTVLMIADGQASFGNSLGIFLMMVSVGTFINAMLMPFVFKFGTEKGAILYYAALGICGASVGMFYGFNGLDYTDGFRISPLLTLLLPAFSAGVFALSWRLSVRLYEKREL